MASPDAFIVSMHVFNARPSSSNNIFLLFATATMFISNKLSFASLLNWSLTISISEFPINPVPTKNTFNNLRSDRKNASCNAFNAFETSTWGITAEMLRSEDPCAIATTFTPFLPSALNMRPLVPGLCFMPSPTTATIDKSVSTGT